MSAGWMTRQWRAGLARRKLRSTWRLLEHDGQVILDEEKPRRLILKVPFYEERVGDQREVRGACWADPLSEPPWISFTPKEGSATGEPRQGIYRLEDKILTVCLAYPGHLRPTAFVALPDIQQVRVYRRGR